MGVSASCIGVVIDTLVQLLDDLSRPYKGIQAHPIHILHSELYILELLAECCSIHWAKVNASLPDENDSNRSDSETSAGSQQDSSLKTSTGLRYGQKRRASRNILLARGKAPQALADDLARRLIDAVNLFLRPVSETSVLPAANILDDTFKGGPNGDLYSQEINFTNGGGSSSESSKLLLENTELIEAYTRGILEYVSCSNWARVLEYFKAALQQAAHQPPSNSNQANGVSDEDRTALITIRLISSFWVDSRKLSIVIQELCGSFLHLRKAYQTTVAIAVPLLITRWLERNPEELIDLHSRRQRLDGGAETLFDMTNTMSDGGRRKALIFPFQTSLLFLLPEVFEVASNMRESKSSSISKKVSFLEMLRKTMRNRNETAIYCLVSVLRVARHFPLESEAALLSYALDVQEEVREAVFRRYGPGTDSANIDRDLMTAAFVSLTHLRYESCVENLAPVCLAPNAPQDFKIAVISSCSHFARQSNADECQLLFAKVSGFMRAQLKASGANIPFDEIY